MDPLELLTREIEEVENHLSRRSFLLHAAFTLSVSRIELEGGDREFLDKVSRTLIPADAIRRTGVDVVANIEHLLARGSAQHRAKVLRLVAWARRVSFFYGGERTALRARTSRFVLARKMSKALSALCLVAFWGDERTLALIDDSEGRR